GGIARRVGALRGGGFGDGRRRWGGGGCRGAGGQARLGGGILFAAASGERRAPQRNQDVHVQPRHARTRRLRNCVHNGTTPLSVRQLRARARRTRQRRAFVKRA